MKVKQILSFDSNNLSNHKIDYSSVIKKIKSIPNPYVGNKKKLLEFFCNIIDKYNLRFETFFDAFCGSAVVGLCMKELGKKVISNDILTSSYFQSVSLVENSGIKLSDDDIDYIINHQNNSASTFVLDHWSVQENVPDSYRKFTINEAKQLDNIRANIKDLSHFIAESIGLTANKLVCMKLPFGFIDRSIDVYHHRKKQIESYGKGSKNHDRRIGIYYDENMDLNFKEWFPKYVKSIQSNIPIMDKNIANLRIQHALMFSQINGVFDSLCCKRTFSSFNRCVSTNCDIIDLLKSGFIDVDCVYFDPPYGGSASDYGELYKFFEEFIYEERVENLPHYNRGMDRFSNKDNYEKNFVEMLSLSQNIPIWIISFNDKSWCEINHLIDIIQSFKKNVFYESSDYEYNYRSSNSRLGSEYIIVAI